MKSKLLVGLLVASSFALGLNASSFSQEVKAILRKDVTVKVEGQPITLTGSEPLVYKGTTYLPVRKVGEAVNKEVKWDEKTNTIDLVKAGLGAKVPADAQAKMFYTKKSALAKHTFGGTSAIVAESEYIVEFDAEVNLNNKQKFSTTFYNQTDCDMKMAIRDISSSKDKILIYEIVIPKGESAAIECGVTGLTKLSIVSYAVGTYSGSGFISMVDACVE